MASLSILPITSHFHMSFPQIHFVSSHRKWNGFLEKPSVLLSAELMKLLINKTVQCLPPSSHPFSVLCSYSPRWQSDRAAKWTWEHKTVQSSAADLHTAKPVHIANIDSAADFKRKIKGKWAACIQVKKFLPMVSTKKKKTKHRETQASAQPLYSELFICIRSEDIHLHHPHCILKALFSINFTSKFSANQSFSMWLSSVLFPHILHSKMPTSSHFKL